MSTQAHATTTHYNSELVFFKAFLDPYMKYTSGLFSNEGESLEQGIRKMLDQLIDASGIKNKKNPRILDIGSGWGALLRRIKETLPEYSYTGISTSEEQNAYVSREIDSNARLITSP